MLGFRGKEGKGKRLRFLCMMVFAMICLGGLIGAGLTGCMTTQAVVPAASAGGAATGTVATTSTTTSTPSASEIANDAVQWLQAAEGVVGTLCQSGAMGSTDCNDAALASGLANFALATFGKTPTPANQTALSNAMAPIYATAIKANTPGTVVKPLPTGAIPPAAAPATNPLPAAAK